MIKEQKKSNQAATDNKPFAIMAADVNALTPVLRKTSAILQAPCVGCCHECNRAPVRCKRRKCNCFYLKTDKPPTVQDKKCKKNNEFHATFLPSCASKYKITVEKFLTIVS